MSVDACYLEIIKKGNQKHAITELDRLSYVVHSIDHDCAIVPYESQKTTITGKLLPNVGYIGQSQNQISHLSNYRHLRNAPEEKKLKIFGSF